MYRIKMLCYEYGNPIPYDDEPAFNPLREKEAAMEEACLMAEEEACGLNDGTGTADMSFGVVIDENADTVRVEQYLLDGPLDDTGQTSVVTKYYLEEARSPTEIEVFGITRILTEGRRNTITSSDIEVFCDEKQMLDEAWRMYSAEYSDALSYGLLTAREPKTRRAAFERALWKGVSVPRYDRQVMLKAWKKPMTM